MAIYISMVILIQCSTTCGSGNQTRNVYCVTLYGQKVNSAFCVSSLKPVESTKCFNTNSCGQWKTSEWAEVCASVCSIKVFMNSVIFHPLGSLYTNYAVSGNILWHW